MEIVLLPEIKLVGITSRTNNASELNTETAQIETTMHNFFSKRLQDKIQNRKNPGTVFAIYTNYENDMNGDYTYFLGEEVLIFSKIEKDFETLTIPPQTYAKFTSNPDQMPKVVIDMWQKIWKMNHIDLGGERAYTADFEIYDERSKDFNKTIVDIYIGIK